MIIDTNALSAIADGDATIQPVLDPPSGFAIPVIVLGEFRYGIRRSRHRARYEAWLSGIMTTCKILIMDEETSIEYAEIREVLRRDGRPIPGNDLWIAAVARQHRLPVLSRDKHFDLVPKLKRVSW